MQDPRQETIRLLVQNFLAVSSLYRQYSHFIPRERAFWLRLADEEEKASDWLQHVPDRMATCAGGMSARCPDRDELVNFGRYVRGLIASAWRRRPTHRQALDTSMYLENTLAERGRRLCVRAISPDMGYILKRLSDQNAYRLRQLEQLRAEEDAPAVMIA
jgi:hypothetical protein